MQAQLGPTIHIMVISGSHFKYLMTLHIFHKYSMPNFKPLLTSFESEPRLLWAFASYRACDFKMASMISKAWVNSL